MKFEEGELQDLEPKEARNLMTIPKLEVEDKREHEGRQENHETNGKTMFDALWLVFIYLSSTRWETPFYK